MKKHFLQYTLFLIMLMSKVNAQELYSYTEPASNMATNSIGVRLTTNLMMENNSNLVRQMYTPEMMWGVSKNVMLHTDGYFSDMNQGLHFNGGSLYIKYRFFSKDDIHSHFRMAVYGKCALNNAKSMQSSINLNGLHSGFEMGLVGTQLIHKVAISSSVSMVHASDVFEDNKFMLMNNNGRNAVNYSLSIGKLMIPKEYISYNQTNINLMIETLGQTNLTSGVSNLDIAPVLQFIIQSKMRIDLGYRLPVSKNLYRAFTEGGMVRFEYNFFNVVK